MSSSIKCPDCGERGYIYGPSVIDQAIRPCPCKGRKLRLEVATGECNGARQGGEPWCGMCEDYRCSEIYRPMTEAEVEEWEHEHQTGWDELIKYEATYQGRKVRVKEEG